MADPTSKPGLFDEVTDKLGNSARDGVKSAVLEYLNGPKGDQKVQETVGSVKTFLLVVGAAVAYYYVKRSDGK